MAEAQLPGVRLPAGSVAPSCFWISEVRAWEIGHGECHSRERPLGRKLGLNLRCYLQRCQQLADSISSGCVLAGLKKKQVATALENLRSLNLLARTAPSQHIMLVDKAWTLILNPSWSPKLHPQGSLWDAFGAWRQAHPQESPRCPASWGARGGERGWKKGASLKQGMTGYDFWSSRCRSSPLYRSSGLA